MRVMVLFVLFSITGALVSGEIAFAEDTATFNYADYKYVLERFVDKNGLVYYKGLKNEREKLDDFIKSLGEVHNETYKQWPKSQRIVFWINAYNAITLRVIIDHYPIDGKSRLHPKNSIRQIPGVWKKLKFRIKGRKWTLHEIEHTALRGWYSEPRVHMALVCAAMSCPPLRNEPYDHNRLDEQFADQTRAFLKKQTNFSIDRDKNHVYLSSIFKWFGKDFVKKYHTSSGFPKQGKIKKSVLNYISRYVSDDNGKYLKNNKYKIKYLEYNWLLNEK